MKYRYEMLVDADSQEEADQVVRALSMFVHRCQDKMPGVSWRWDVDGNVSFT